MLNHRTLFLVAAISILLQIAAGVVGTEYGDALLGTSSYKGAAKKVLYYLGVLFVLVGVTDSVVHGWRSLQIWLLYPVFLTLLFVTFLAIGKPG